MIKYHPEYISYNPVVMFFSNIQKAFIDFADQLRWEEVAPMYKVEYADKRYIKLAKFLLCVAKVFSKITIFIGTRTSINHRRLTSGRRNNA